MSADVDHILDLIGQDRITKDVLQHHGFARESFRLPNRVVADSEEFDRVITSYLEHHVRSVSKVAPASSTAFGEARRILDLSFDAGGGQSGYSVALQMALDGSRGGLGAVIDRIADTLTGRALRRYLDSVYHEISPLSSEDNRSLSRAFFERFGYTLRRFGLTVDENTLAGDTRTALDYHRQAIEQIIGIAGTPRR